MARKIIWLKLLAITLVSGMAIVGCDTGSTNDQKTDSDLNGTWVFETEGKSIYENTFDNGYWEQSINGIPNLKGTYTASNGILTTSISHINGSIFNIGLESKWYLKNELETELKRSGEFSEENIKEIIKTYDNKESIGYSIKGNTLSFNGGELGPFTRKN